MTPEEKINYALSLVEGLSFCAYCGTPIEEDEHCITGYRHTAYEPPHDAGIEQDPEYPMPTPVSANLIPAALRLAREVNKYGGGGNYAPVRAALDAFLALLPEPPKEVA